MDYNVSELVVSTGWRGFLLTQDGIDIEVEAGADKTKYSRDDENGVFNFAVDGEMILLSDDYAQNEAQRENEVAVVFDPDGAKDKINEDF